MATRLSALPWIVNAPVLAAPAALVPWKVRTFNWNDPAKSLEVKRLTAVVGPLKIRAVSSAEAGVASQPAAGPADQRSGAVVVLVASVGV